MSASIDVYKRQPLMIVCISSLLTISIFESHSIYALRLAREGKLLTHHIDKAALTLLGLSLIHI